jgi:hypothetical protein
MSEVIKLMWDCRRCEKWGLCKVCVKDGAYDPVKDGCLSKKVEATA